MRSGGTTVAMRSEEPLPGTLGKRIGEQVVVIPRATRPVGRLHRPCPSRPSSFLPDHRPLPRHAPARRRYGAERTGGATCLAPPRRLKQHGGLLPERCREGRGENSLGHTRMAAPGCIAPACPRENGRRRCAITGMAAPQSPPFAAPILVPERSRAEQQVKMVASRRLFR
jgi:hypothetical protein